MASGKGPYYVELPNLRGSGSAAESSQPVYPDLSQSSAPDSSIYALADGALQAHAEHNQIASLVIAATAAADSDGRGQRQQQTQHSEGHEQQQQHQPADEIRRSTRKRKRGSAAENAGLEGGDAADGQASPVAGPAGENIVTSASALFRRPSTASRKYTRPPMSRLFQSLQLSPENFLKLQSAAKNYMLDPAHPDRQDTVGQRGKGDSELVKLKLWTCVKDFLEGEGNGEKFFGPAVPGDEGQPRTMIWPRDKNSIIGAITPLLRRMVTNERQRQYAVETRKGGGASTGDTPSKSGAQLEAERQRPLDDLFQDLTGMGFGDYDGACGYDSELLSSLLAETGLSESQAARLVAVVDHHFRHFHRFHTANRDECSEACQNSLIGRIVSSGYLDHGSCGVGAKASLSDKRKNMTWILQQLFPIVREAASATPPQDIPEGRVARNNAAAAAASSPLAEPFASLTFHINLLDAGGRRVFHKRGLGHDACRSLQDAISQASFPGEADAGGAVQQVRVLTPAGLIAVGSDEEWEGAKMAVHECEWMDGEVRVLVELGGQGEA